MMQVMMYAFPAYLVPNPQIDGDLSPDLDRLLKIASLVITIPVILFSATPFFKGAIRDLKFRHIGMDVPVALGILLTFFASLWATFFGGAVYFDSAIMFVFLLLGARFIEESVKQKTSAALNVLTQIHPNFAQRMLHYPEQRNTEVIPADIIQKDDVIYIAAGDQIPCDGVVLEGDSSCDEALMTGESAPIHKSPDANLIAGAINLQSPLILRAERVGKETQLANLISMMESAATEKPLLIQIADRHASRFLILILCLALLAGLGWAMVEPQRALWIAISVIVVTCPCALSLATPGVMSAAIGKMAKHGVLVTKGKAIESLAKITHVVFDKTGTLTYGRLKLVYVDCLIADREPISKVQAQERLLAVAKMSLHPVSKAITDYFLSTFPELQKSAAITELASYIEQAGSGMQASIGGRCYRLGKLDYVTALSNREQSVPAKFAGKTISAFGDDSGVLFLFALEDSLREEAIEVVKQLHAMGKQVLLLSGDNIEVVAATAMQCGIDDSRGALLPAEKYSIIRKLQSDGAKVAMVGDGMNDGPALSIADVSVAMGQGAPIAQTRSDFLLMSNRLSDFGFAIKVSTKAFQLIRQNIAWAIVYNIVAIPAAILGFLEPWHAALGMSVSSLIVVLNGLRLLRMHPPGFVIDIH
jgi:Cu2+-exporting ATPase